MAEDTPSQLEPQLQRAPMNSDFTTLERAWTDSWKFTARNRLSDGLLTGRNGRFRFAERWSRTLYQEKINLR